MKSFAKIPLYWHAIRYLKPIQIYRRFWFIFYKPKLKSLKTLKVRRNLRGWKSPVNKPISLISSNHVRFLNNDYILPDAGGWNNQKLDKLFLYNLHYFDDLSANDAHLRSKWHEQLIHRWILENPLTKGVGWDPYPTSLRIVNWIKWALKGNQLSDICLQSLCNQAHWLSKRLEWHLLGNHLFANAKSLIFAGLFFQGNIAQKWLKKGISIIQKEIHEQILKDGGHFERSPMYHAIFLEDILDLINMMQIYAGEVEKPVLDLLESSVFPMLDWLQNMSHPDGEISLFNDAAFAIAPKFEDLIEYARSLGICCQGLQADFLHSSQGKISVKNLKESGYIRIESSNAVSILDVAPLGPDYLPGHGHADTLSFELSVFNQRIVVNRGTSCYGEGNDRLEERKTSAHSTVEINNESSSQVWGGFRVGQRAYPFNLHIEETPELLRVSCSHNGYERLSGSPIHRRFWEMKEDSLKIHDEVSGNLPSVARYILHPSIHCLKLDKQLYALKLLNQKTIYFNVEVGEVILEQGTYSPEFGRKMNTHVLVVKLKEGKAISFFSWNKNAYSFLNR